MNNSTVIDVMVLIFLFRMQQTHSIHAVSRPPSVAFHSGADDLYCKRACTHRNMSKHSVRACIDVSNDRVWFLVCFGEIRMPKNLCTGSQDQWLELSVRKQVYYIACL